MDEIGRNLVRMGKTRNSKGILIKKSEAKLPHGRSRLRKEDNVKIYLNEIGYNGVGWIHTAQNRD
jgi:hypothetical protein